MNPMTTDHNAPVDTAMEKGIEAARLGKSEKANPYDLGDSVRFGAWLAGWIKERNATRQ